MSDDLTPDPERGQAAKEAFARRFGPVPLTSVQQRKAAGIAGGRADRVIEDEISRVLGMDPAGPGADAATWTAADAADDQPDDGSWCVILLSHLPYHIAHAWWIDGGQAEAEQFAAFVSEEIDPAIAVRLDESAGELLRWRTHVAKPAIERAGRARALAQRLLDSSHYSEGDDRDPAVVAQLRIFAGQFLDVIDGEPGPQ